MKLYDLNLRTHTVIVFWRHSEHDKCFQLSRVNEEAMTRLRKGNLRLVI